MKIRQLLSFTPLVLIAAGCAQHEQKQARFDESLYPNPDFSASAVAGSSSASQGAGIVPGSGEQSGAYSSSPSASYSPNNTGANTNMNVEDGVLAREVQQSLAQDPTVVTLLPAIQITANQGTVTLSGNVASPEQKQSIESIALRTTGVTAVNNQIQVSSESAAIQTSDSLVTSSNQVEGTSEQLSQTSRTNSDYRIFVPTNAPESSVNQPPPMTATSSRPDQSSRTYESTNSATGTYSSQSGQYSTGQNGAVNVNVQGSSQADRTLAQQISQELRADAGLASAISQISISVADGKVSLRGNVKNDEQKRQIESAIQRITGVSSVDNQLQVSSSQTTPMNPIPKNP